MISIHALREEGDGEMDAGIHADWEFLSTPSARRATTHGPLVLQQLPISIHALREEGDLAAVAKFNNSPIFLSTPSARRATMFSVAAGEAG